MNRLRTSLLLVGIAIAVALICFRTSGPRASKNSAPEAQAAVAPTPNLEVPDTAPRSIAPDSTLAKLDPILVERLKSYHQSEVSPNSAPNWNAMLVLNLPAGLQETLANAFEQDSETSSAQFYNDRSPHRSKTDSELENAYAKRMQALEQQAEILEDLFDSFLTEHPGLAEQNVQTRLRLAPMISIKASPEQILELAEADAIRYIGADTPAEKAIERVASEARFPHAWNSDFLDAAGVKVALLEEYDVPFSNLVGPGKPIKSPAAIYDPDSVTDHEHSSNTAAILWGQDPFFRGLALGSTPYFATAETTSGRAAATDWCIQQGVSIISMSWGSPAHTNDGNLKWFDLYYDWVTEINRVLVVAAAGNDGNAAGRVIHPGAAFNVLTVGALDGKNPNTWSDDVVANFSSHVDPNTGTMKPEVVSYGTNIKAAGVAPAFSTLSSGTSYATPAVAAAAALCIQENPGSADEPMLLKAQLMASGVAHDFPGTDRDGVGTVLAQAYNAATSARTINRTGTTNLEWNINLDGGRKNRIVLCYPHRPTTSAPPNSGSPVNNHNSYHEIDFDLELWVGGAKVAQSDFGINNPFEVIDYTPPSSTPATVRIVRFDWKAGDPRDSVRVGLAHGSNLNFGTGPDDSNDDSFEPNDSSAEAQTLPLKTNLTDMRSTDEDWFRINVPPHTFTEVRIDFDNDIGNLNLFASPSSNPSDLRSSTSQNDFESVNILTGATEETWIARVIPSSSVEDRTSYKLTVNSDLPLRAPVPLSPSNSVENADSLVLTCGSATVNPDDANPRSHASTRWQIAENAAFSTIRFDQTAPSETQFNVPGGVLDPGRAYFWRVRHIDQDNRPGPWSSANSFQLIASTGFPTAPPAGLTQRWLGSALNVTWDPIPDTDSYQIYLQSGGSSGNGTQIGVSNTPDYVFQNLIAGEQYRFAVTASKNGIETDPSEFLVRAPASRVDGLIGEKRNRLRGDNQFSTSGKGQRVLLPLSNTGRGTIFFAGENQGALRSHLHFRMRYSRRNLKVRVKTEDGLSQNVSAAMKLSGYLVPSVAARSMARFKARVKMKRKTGPRQQTLRVFQSSVTNSGAPLSIDTTLSKIRR